MRHPASLRRILLSVLIVILVGLLFYRWRHRSPATDGTWDRVQESRVLRIGMDASYPPFSDTIAGTPVGLDVDLANEIGRRLGVRVDIVNMSFDGLYDSLYTGQIDALISALSIDPMRIGKVIYTQGYVDAGQVLVSRNGDYTLMPELEGKTVAVEYGSYGDELARTWERRLHLLKMARFVTSEEAMQAVIEGKAQAALVDQITARLYRRTQPDLVISPSLITHDPYTVAVRITSYDLGGAIGDVLKQMDQDGTLAAILDRWL
jgi:ABC-type amino acid transport substrate-binding protein